VSWCSGITVLVSGMVSLLIMRRHDDNAVNTGTLVA